jgi:hypothetical protein
MGSFQCKVVGCPSRCGDGGNGDDDDDDDSYTSCILSSSSCCFRPFVLRIVIAIIFVKKLVQYSYPEAFCMPWSKLL